METSNEYIGKELGLFQHAVHWKRYWRSQIQPFLGKMVLEVGAGIGGTTSVFAGMEVDSWLCLEPDSRMVETLKSRQSDPTFPKHVSVQCGTIEDLPSDMRFDTILYMDVLEHIEKDGEELCRAKEHLTDDGNIIVLSPALNLLYSPFDKQVGYFRRYSKKTLLAAAEEAKLKTVRLRYLDSVGSIANLTNRLFLKQSYPTPRQLAIWDGCMVPCSRWFLDKITMYLWGKSVLGIFRK